MIRYLTDPEIGTYTFNRVEKLLLQNALLVYIDQLNRLSKEAQQKGEEQDSIAYDEMIQNVSKMLDEVLL